MAYEVALSKIAKEELEGIRGSFFLKHGGCSESFVKCLLGRTEHCGCGEWQGDMDSDAKDE